MPFDDAYFVWGKLPGPPCWGVTPQSHWWPSEMQGYWIWYPSGEVCFFGPFSGVEAGWLLTRPAKRKFVLDQPTFILDSIWCVQTTRERTDQYHLSSMVNHLLRREEGAHLERPREQPSHRAPRVMPWEATMEWTSLKFEWPSTLDSNGLGDGSSGWMNEPTSEWWRRDNEECPTKNS
jgi:hypothetical protein